MRHGFGFELFSSGSFYEGEFKKDKPHGKGSFYNALTKEKYSGEWFQGLKHGYGIWVRDRFSYGGFWLNNEPHGYGILRYDNGDLYEGKFAFGLKQGTGQEQLIDGTKYIGHFRGGLYDGYGQLTKPEGESYVGQFKKGKMDGRGHWIVPENLNAQE